jgi:hypothetical protein
MNNVMYFLAIILILLWALGFFVYNTGGLIHILLVLAVLAVLLRIIKGDQLFK